MHRVTRITLRTGADAAQRAARRVTVATVVVSVTTTDTQKHSCDQSVVNGHSWLTSAQNKAIVDTRLCSDATSWCITSDYLLDLWPYQIRAALGELVWSFALFAMPMLGHYVQTWRHPQKRKYITYHNAATGGPSHGHRQHVSKFRWNLDMWFMGYACGQTYRHIHRNTLHTWSLPGVKQSGTDIHSAWHSVKVIIYQKMTHTKVVILVYTQMLLGNGLLCHGLKKFIATYPVPI